MIMMFASNTIIFFDLYFTITNPFESQNSRAKKEAIFLVLLTLASYLMIVAESDNLQRINLLAINYLFPLLSSVILICVITIVLRLFKTRTNRKIKKIIINRNIC